MESQIKETAANTNIEINVNDFDKICRTCLSATEKNQPIFALKYNETSVLNFFESCASVHVGKLIIVYF